MSSSPPDDFDFIETYMNLKECVGTPMPWIEFRKVIQATSAQGLFLRCSQIMSDLANEPEGGSAAPVQIMAKEVAARWRFAADPRLRQIGLVAFLKSSKFNAFHEKNMLLLQSMALLYGSQDKDLPPIETMILLALAASDHLAPLDGQARMRTMEWFTAFIFQEARFNHRRDPIADFVRPIMILGSPPPRGILADPAEWEALQSVAFGMPLQDYYRQLAAPLFLFSFHWAYAEPGPKKQAPVINPELFFSATTTQPDLATKFFEGVSQSAEEARTALLESVRNGKPTSFAPLLRRPFVRFSRERLVAVSPWAVREHLRLGLWDRFRQASKGQRDGTVWMSAFGDMFEAWCQGVARRVEQSLPAGQRFLIPTTSGAPDEIEDLVLLDEDTAVLFSMKGKVLPEGPARTATRAEDILAWLDGYFFCSRSGKHRKGVLRLLDDKVRQIRAGRHADRIPAHVKVIPVIVTYDLIPDGAATYDWLRRRCHLHGLFQSDDVAPVTLMSGSDFEHTMGLVAQGVNVLDVLRLRLSPRFQDCRWSVLLHDRAPEGEIRRPAWLDDEFERLGNEIHRTVFANANVAVNPTTDDP